MKIKIFSLNLNILKDLNIIYENVLYTMSSDYFVTSYFWSFDYFPTNNMCYIRP